MASISDLSVKVSAKTADFQAGMQSAQRGLSGLRNDAMETAASMQVLQGRLDEAGDEAQSAGKKAGASSGGFLALAGAAATTKVSFDSLSVVTIGSLIPAILTLTTVMAPLTAALGGFVAVAGSIAGVGLLGFMGAAMTQTDRLKTEFQALTQTVQEEFAPVFQIFGDVLVNLIQELTSIIPELVPAEDVIRRIAGQFEQLGMAIINVLPALMDMAITLTDQFLPPFVRLVENVLPKAPGFFMSLVPVMQEVGATLQPLVAAISDLRPQITQFGMVVLNTIVPALTTLVTWFGTVLERLTQMDTETQALIAKITLLTPVVSGLAQVFGGPLMMALGGLVTTISGPLLTGLLSITGAFTSLVGVVTGLGPALTGIAATLSAMSPTLAGLIGVVTSAVTTFGSFSAIITAVSGTLTSVALTLSTMSPALAGVIGTVITATTTFSSFLVPLGSVLTTFGSLITTLTATLGPIGLLIGSIGALGYAFKQNRQVITRFANLAIAKLQDVIRNAATWIQANGPPLIKRAFRAIGEGLRFVALDIYNAITGNGDSIIKSIIIDSATWIRANGPGLLKAAAKFAFDAIMAAARGLYQGLIGNSLIPEMFRAIATYIRTTATSLIQSAIQSLVNRVTSLFANLRTQTVSSIRRWGTQISSLVTNVRNRIVQTVTTLTTQVVSRFRNFVTQTVARFNTLRTQVVNRVNQIRTRVVQAITNLTTQARNRIQTFVTTTVSQFQRLVTQAVSQFNNLRNRVTTTITNLTNQAVSRFNNLRNRAISAVRNLVSQATSQFNNLRNRVNTTISNLTNQAINRFNNLRNSAVRAITNLTNQVVSQFTSLKNSAVSQVDSLRSSVVSSARSLRSRFSSAISSLQSDVVSTVQSMESQVVSAVESLASQTVSVAKGWVDDFVQPFKDAASEVEGTLSTLKEEAVGNSIVPDMLDEMVNESSSWIDDFVSPFQDAKDRVLDKFSQMKDGASGISDAVMENVSGTNWDNILELRLGHQGIDTQQLAKSINKELANKGAGTRVTPQQLEEERVSGRDQATDWAKEQVKRQVREGMLPESSLDRFGIPSLDTGGYIEEDGLAQLHAGERVVRAAEVERDGGGDTINIEVDARGSEDPHQVRRNAERGLAEALEARNVRR